MILGWELLPFSAGQLVLLTRIESPFITGKPVGEADLLNAAWYCSRPYAEAALGLFHGMNLRLRLKAWKTAFDAWRNKSLIAAQINEFKKHIADGWREPRYIWRKTKNEDGTDIKLTYAPLVMMLLRDLHPRYTFDQVMDMPLRRATFERFGVLELEANGGIITWKTPAEMEVSSG